jgi:hypothetical protein
MAAPMHHGRVPSWGSFSYAFGPIVAIVLVGVFALVLRWAFRRGASVVAGPGRPGDPSEYGLLVAIATPRTLREGQALQRRLQDAGIRANLASTVSGPALMVWPADADAARSLLTRRRAD